MRKSDRWWAKDIYVANSADGIWQRVKYKGNDIGQIIRFLKVTNKRPTLWLVLNTNGEINLFKNKTQALGSLLENYFLDEL